MGDNYLSDFLRLAEEFIVAIQQACDDDCADIDGILLHTELLLRDVALVEEFVAPEIGELLFEEIAAVARAVKQLADENLRRHRRGRPQINISEHQLSLLVEHQFTIQAIASLFHVSHRTIRRRIDRYGLNEAISFSDITDCQLDEITGQFVQSHPFSGQRSLDGFLRGFGLRVQRYRIRDSLNRIDPRGVQQRLRHALHRRRYNVCMPNSLWHIDGHHKLIRWCIVTHGGIDGYSRLPVFLRASTNNRAETMLQGKECLTTDYHEEFAVIVVEKTSWSLNLCLATQTMALAAEAA